MGYRSFNKDLFFAVKWLLKISFYKIIYAIIIYYCYIKVWFKLNKRILILVEFSDKNDYLSAKFQIYYTDKVTILFNTFATTCHICVTQRLVSRVRRHICVTLLITHTCVQVDYQLLLNCCWLLILLIVIINCWWLSIYVFYMCTNEDVRRIT